MNDIPETATQCRPPNEELGVEACSPLTDTDRINFLVQRTHCEFWVHHPSYGTQGKRFACEGVVMRAVIDSAIKWHSANS